MEFEPLAEVTDNGADAPLYLFKLPAAVVESIGASETGSVVATLRVFRAAPGPPPSKARKVEQPRVQLLLAPSVKESAQLPSVLDVTLEKKIGSKRVFSRYSGAGASASDKDQQAAFAVDGVVKHEGFAKWKPSAETRAYEERLRHRGEVQALTDVAAPFDPFMRQALEKKFGPKPERKEFSRKVRTGEHELKEMLFRLFAENEYWGSEELATKTNQPSAFVKEVLAEVADLCKDGEFRHKWHLKPEHQQAVRMQTDSD